jgi:uncharacterized membrane protein YfcA
MDLSVILYIVVGFIAQMIDGSLGMGYGVSCNTFLLALGIPPAVGSASVHAAEVVTTGISGLAHHRLGNINKDLFLRLLIPGAIGGGLGAYVLTRLDGSIIKPYIAIYLLVMGVIIIIKASARCRCIARSNAASNPWRWWAGFSMPSAGEAGVRW